MNKFEYPIVIYLNEEFRWNTFYQLRKKRIGVKTISAQELINLVQKDLDK